MTSLYPFTCLQTPLMLEPRAPHWKSPHLAFYASFCLFLSQQVPSPLLTLFLHLLNGDLIPPSGEFGKLRARGLAGVIMSCPCVLAGQGGAQVPPLGLFSPPVPLGFPLGTGQSLYVAGFSDSYYSTRLFLSCLNLPPLLRMPICPGRTLTRCP